MLDMEHIKSAFARQTILIIGDIMLDRYYDGTADRMSPEAPVPVLDHQSTKECLGGAANVALNVKSLGGRPLLCGLVGKDEAGSSLRRLLQQEQLNSELVLDSPERRTTVKTRVMAAGRHLLRIDSEDRHDLSASEENRLLDQLRMMLQTGSIDAIILQDYNKGLLTDQIIQQVISLAHDLDIFISVDPKKKRFTAYQGVTLFKPNLKEVRESVFPKISPEHSSLEEAHRILKDQIRHRYTMITLSKHGLFLADREQGALYPTQVREVKDVCGAGDAVISIATMGFVAGLSLKQVAELSNLAGGMVCGVSGVAPVDINLLT